jgi:hypothetical protein
MCGAWVRYEVRSPKSEGVPNDRGATSEIGRNPEFQSS